MANSTSSRSRDWLILGLTFAVASLILYGYLWITRPTRLEIIYQNWDGPTYVAIAESLYQPQILRHLPYAQFQSPEGFASSFPLYPLLIRAFAFLGYFRAAIFISLTFSLAAVITFYELVRELRLTRLPLWLATVFIFLPPRWFVTSHIGSSEPVFIFFLLMSLKYFFRHRYWLSGINLALAQLTRSQGLLFFVGFSLLTLATAVKSAHHQLPARLKHSLRSFAPYLLSPVALVGLFSYFRLQFGNFWAFTTAIAKWSQLGQWPFQVFTAYPHPLVSSYWLQNHFWIYFVDILTIIQLCKHKHYSLAILAGVYLLPLLWLVHMDLGRYNLPLAPFVLMAFAPVITQKSFLAATALLLPALYAFTIKFMLWNR